MAYIDNVTVEIAEGINHENVDDRAMSTYCNEVVEQLKILVSRSGVEMNDVCIGEIRELLARRLPDSACAEGAEDLIAPLRAKLWSVMLLGLRPEDLNRYDEVVLLPAV